MPYPRIDEEDLADPEWHIGDLDRWHKWLGQAGITLERPWFDTTVKDVTWGIKQGVMGLRWPFKTFFDRTKTSQQWGLFAVVTTKPDALIIEVRRHGEWEELYRRLDREHDWRDNMLKYRRLRGVWDGVKDEPKGTYKRFSVWLAKEVFLEQPDVDRVRILLEKRTLVFPWEEPVPERERRAERYHKRKNHMPSNEAR